MKFSEMWSCRSEAQQTVVLLVFNSTLFKGYRDSSQSRIGRFLSHGASDLRDTGLTFAMALRFISRSTFA